VHASLVNDEVIAIRSTRGCSKRDPENSRQRRYICRAAIPPIRRRELQLPNPDSIPRTKTSSTFHSIASRQERISCATIRHSPLPAAPSALNLHNNATPHPHPLPSPVHPLHPLRHNRTRSSRGRRSSSNNSRTNTISYRQSW
jgi:hypothetical protein